MTRKLQESINESSAKDAAFCQIAGKLRRAIRRGEWMPGESLPSMDEIAHEYGVHRNTVGAAMQILQEENMVLSRPRTGTIVANDFSWKRVAILFPDTAFGHWKSIFKEIKYFLEAKGWALELFTHHGQLELMRRHLETIANGDFAGAIISIPLALLREDGEPLSDLLTSGFPVIFIGGGINCWSVDDNLYASGYWGTKHLIDQGYKRIAFVGCRSYDGEVFVDGCKRALSEANLDDFGTGYSEDSDFALKILNNWLILDKRPDAIFYQRSDHGKQCFYFLQAKNIQIGPEIGFMVLDDTTFHRYTAPAPSAVRRYPGKIGKKAVELFLELVSIPRKTRLGTLDNPKQLTAEFALEPGRSSCGRRNRKLIYRAINRIPTVEEQLREYYPPEPGQGPGPR